MFQTIGITCKREVDDAKHFEELINFLLKEGKQVMLSSHARDNLGEKFADLPLINYAKAFDLLIAYGGDGTILRAARNIKHKQTSILGINAGQLGFLASLPRIGWKTELMKIFEGHFKQALKTQLKVVLSRKGKRVFTKKVLNDMVISYKNVARLVNIDTKINTEELCTYKADGLIIATPTGSTAYNLAAGGPILYPSLSAMIITPICSHSLTQKPIVIPGEKVLHFSFEDNDEMLSLTLDGQQGFEIGNEDKVTVTMMDYPLTFIKPENESFFKTIREKLGWGKNLR